MVPTEKMRSIVKKITIIISAHTALIVICSYAHAKVDLLYAMTEYTPILLLLCLSPLVPIFFLSTRSARQGSILLLGILPAELIYNILTRFNALSPITRIESELIWKIIYEGSFGSILVLEVIGFWLTLKLLRDIHKQLSSPNNAAE